MRVLLVLGVVASMLAPAACVDEATTTAFTVWAFEAAAREDVDAPLVGAEVAFDPPGGGARVIARTAADGHATFEGDFSRGGASITIYDPDHVLVSALQASPETARARPNPIGKPESDLVMFAPRRDDALRRSTLELRGALLSRRDPMSTIDLSASGLPRLGSAITTDASYALRAPQGRPFFLLGHEIKSRLNEPENVDNEHLGSFRIDVAAASVDTTLDVDLARATALATTAVRVRAELPTQASSPFGAGTRASAIVVSADSTLLVAPIRSVRGAADGRAFDLVMTVAQTDIAPERPLTRAALVAPDGSRSVRVEPGIVADGTTWSDFPVPLFVPEASRSLAQPLPLDDFPAGADLVVEIYEGTQLAWLVSGPPGGLRERPVTLPPPVGLRLPALVAVSLIAKMDRVALSPRGEAFRRTAITRDVLMRR